MCTAHCEERGASWALVEYGHECFCADVDTELDRLGPATCDHDCDGDDALTCGGRDAFNVIPVSEYSFFVASFFALLCRADDATFYK